MQSFHSTVEQEYKDGKIILAEVKSNAVCTWQVKIKRQEELILKIEQPATKMKLALPMWTDMPFTRGHRIFFFST